MILKRKILQRIFGPKRNNEGNYEIKANRELTTHELEIKVFWTRRESR